MDPTADELKRDIEATRDAMTHKLGRIEAHVKGSVDESVSHIKGAVDIRRHVVERPWATLGAIAVAGFALGHLRQPIVSVPLKASRMSDRRGPPAMTYRGSEPFDAGAGRRPGLLDELFDQLGGKELKVAAVAAVVGAAGDWLKSNLPRFGNEIDRARGQNGLHQKRKTTA